MKKLLFLLLTMSAFFDSHSQDDMYYRLLIEGMASKQRLIDERRQAIFNLHREIFEIVQKADSQKKFNQDQLDIWEDYKNKKRNYEVQDLSNSKFYYSVLNWMYDNKSYFSRWLQ